MRSAADWYFLWGQVNSIGGGALRVASFGVMAAAFTGGALSHAYKEPAAEVVASVSFVPEGVAKYMEEFENPALMYMFFLALFSFAISQFAKYRHNVGERIIDECRNECGINHTSA